ncbi:MAG: choice-of-anchor D domain-containing protein [Paludibacter sp.]|nr:choice-of-anchor D domain-containing protein [Paludibacter sp.]
MKLKLKHIALLAIFFAGNATAQLQLSLPALTADKSATIAVPVMLTNSSSVTALQFEMNFPADMECIGASLGSRKEDHSLSASVISTGKVRVIVYSTTQKAFTGTSGTVVEINLKVGTLPGANTISLSNVVMSNEAGATLTATTVNGSITVNGPRAELETTQIDYGRVANGLTGSASVTIYNRGNQTFNITSATSTDAHFTVGTSLPASVPANSSKTLIVNFNNASGDFDVTGELTIVNSDPEAERSTFKIPLKAVAYSLNTIAVGSVSGKTGTEIRVPVSISNQANLSGVQLEITLPDSAQFVANSLTKGDMIPVAFQYSANQSGNRLRILLYASDNSTIAASAGELCAFKLKMNNYPATYNNTLSSVILSNTAGRNVLSSSTNGTLQLTAPQLSVESTVAYGTLNVGQTLYEKSFSVSNSGNEPLVISAFNFSNTQFRIKSVSLPLTLAAHQSTQLTMQLVDVEPGQKATTMTVVSNERTSEINVAVSAQIFANFELAALNITERAGNSTQFDFSIKNDLTVTAFQFDLALPSEISIATLNLVPTNRLTGWTLEYSKLANGQFRILGYSPSKVAVAGTDGIIFSVPFQLPQNMIAGQYALVLSNIIIANAKGENVVTKATNGVINVTDMTTGFTAAKSNIILKQLPAELHIQATNNCIIQLYDMQGRLVYQQESTSNLTIIPLKRNFVGVVKIISVEEIVMRKIRL